MRLGAVEAGGTKMVLAVGDVHGIVEKYVEIPTDTPQVTGPQIVDFFRENRVASIGVGAFGPIQLNRNSKDYGRILHTPKVAWENVSWFDLLDACNCPIGIDTDVNAACLGEVRHGNGKGLQHVLYLTIGTGVGAGVWSDGKLLHGMLHPEAGHILIQKKQEDTFPCNCRYHQNCLEGLAAGPALKSRYKILAEQLPKNHEAWELEADYIAQALVNYILCYSPQRIILGGGVMKQTHLFPMIRKKTAQYMNQYIETEELRDMEHYIMPAKLNGTQGIVGCLALAELERKKRGELV